MSAVDSLNCVPIPKVGLGLRHPHYADALSSVAPIDFVEVHSENFFAEGGASIAVLEEIHEKYPISLHSTAMGLGSANDIPAFYLKKLKSLAEKVNPILMSDHASFSWSQLNTQQIHVGDLLPLSFNEHSLMILANNVDKVQQFLGRTLLIENLSAYVQIGENNMTETEFLVGLTELTGCKLLVDLNNIIVTAYNRQERDVLLFSRTWLDNIPAGKIGEFHLAGYSEVAEGELIIDDHSQAVSQECWTLYHYALEKFGDVPTLIERDNNLPSWEVLLKDVEIARGIVKDVFSLNRAKV
jgi:uncharacterized protein (UPF0276 family)